MNRKVMYRFAFAAAAAAVFFASAPLRAAEIDDQIEASFKKTYVYKTYLKDDAIKAKSENGLVTLTGTVADDSRKTLAQETAANLPGVTRVDNRLETEAEADAGSADSWIGTKVKMALLFRRNVSGMNTDVAVKDGVVTLKGKVSSRAQKDLATEYAKDIEGVKEVQNQMVVEVMPDSEKKTMSEKIDDASVTAQVKAALLTHRSTKAVTTKVTTRDGTVTLTGKAKNEAEKSLVTKLVSDIQGVTGVKNEMTVEELKTK